MEPGGRTQRGRSLAARSAEAERPRSGRLAGRGKGSEDHPPPPPRSTPNQTKKSNSERINQLRTKQIVALRIRAVVAQEDILAGPIVAVFHLDRNLVGRIEQQVESDILAVR